MYTSYRIDSLASMVKEYVLPLVNTFQIVTLKGSVGAGKTTLAKELLRQAGVLGLVTSPTFAYVNSYKAENGRVFHHFDLYRIESLDSFLMNGFDEYLHDSSSVCIVEWPEVIDGLLQAGLLKQRTCHLTISYDLVDSDRRHIQGDI